MTLYRLMEPQDAGAVAEFDRLPSGWPAVVAEDEDQIVGIIATRDRDDLIEVERLKARSPRVALRLIEAYENLMRALGVVEYRFAVSADDEQMAAIVAHAPGIECYGGDELARWYRRRLDNVEQS